MEWLQNPDELRAEVAQGTDTAPIRRELTEIEQGLAQITKGRANIIRILERGAIAADAMLESLNRLREREQDLKARQQELHPRLAQGSVTEQELQAWRHTAQQWLDRIQEMDPAERKQLVRTLVTRVVAHETSLTVSVRWPSLFQPAPDCNRERDPHAPAQPEAGEGGGLAVRSHRGRPGGQRDHPGRFP